MSNFSSLKAAIQQYIKTNGNEEITGAVLQDILLSMVSVLGDTAINDLETALQTETTNRTNEDGALSARLTTAESAITTINTKLGEGYVYAGIATTSTNPGTPTGKVFYIATAAGTYTYFGSLVVTQGINILKYNGSIWAQEQIIGIDEIPTYGSNAIPKSGGVYASIGLQFLEWQYRDKYVSSNELHIGDNLFFNDSEGFSTFKVFVSKGDKLSMIDIKGANASTKIFVCNLNNVIIAEIDKVSGTSYESYDYVATQNCYVVASSAGKGRVVYHEMDTKFDMVATENSDNFLTSGGVAKSIKNSIKAAEGALSIVADFSIAGYVHTDGDFRPGGDSYLSTDFINVSGFKALKFSGNVVGSVLAGLSLYDEDRVMIGYLGSGTYTNEAVTIPDKAMFVRMSAGVSYVTGYGLTVSVSNAITADSNKKVKVDLNWQPCNYINSSGAVVKYASSQFSVSRRIYLHKNANYYIDGKSTGGSVLIVAFYSADGTLVGSIAGANTNHSMEKLTIPATAVYMMMTYGSAGSTGFDLYVEPYVMPSVIDTERSGSLSDLVKAGGTIYLEDVNYVVDQTISIPSDTTIIGNGRTKIYLGNTTKIFQIDNKSNIRISGIEFIGKDVIAPGDSQTAVINVSEIKTRQLDGTDDAIYITNADSNVIIEDCVFHDFSRAGIDIYRSHEATHSKHAKISNCNFYNCWYGVLFDVRAEFNAVVNCSFNLNKIGMYVAGGNNLITNCHFDLNECGFCVCSILGENGDHGAAANCTFNHNVVYGIACVNVVSGFIFTGANMYEGSLLLDAAIGIQVVNSVIAVAIINQNTPNFVSLITNNLFHTTYGGGIITSKTGLILKNNYYYDGSDSTDLNN